MIHDLLIGLRQLLRHPGFTLLTSVTLAIGVAVTTVIFAIYHGTMLATPSFTTRGDRLVFLEHYQKASPDAGVWGMSEAGFLEVASECRAIEELCLVQSRTMILTGRGMETERILGNWITAGGLSMLGVEPVLGRVFEEDEGEPGRWNVLVLGYELWQRRYGGDPSVLGRRETINGEPAEIIGVMPPRFDFLRRSEAWMPFRHDRTGTAKHSAFGLDAFGLLAPGEELAEANKEVEGLFERLAQQHPEVYSTVGARALPVRAFSVRGEGRDAMRLLLGALVLILTITCANVSNLLLIRMSGRVRELATRAALGSPRWRLVRLLLAESLLLAVFGGVAGMLLGWWGLDLIGKTLPSDLPRWLQLGIGGKVLLVASVVSLGAALLCGLIPALKLTGRGLLRDLRDGGRGATIGAATARLRSGLVILQVALAVVLLSAAGLSLRSHYQVQTQDLGYRTEGVLTFRVGLPPTQYTDKQQVKEFFQALAPALREIPGVEAAALTTSLPGAPNLEYWYNIDIGDQPAALPPDQEPTPAIGIPVTPDFFRTLDLELVEGRDFTEADTSESEAVVIVTRSFVERILGAGPVLGRKIGPRRVGEGSGSEKWTIIGVVEDARVIPMLEPGKHPPVAFTPLAQTTVNFASGVVRTNEPRDQVVAAIKRKVVGIEPGIPIYNVETLRGVLDTQMWGGRLFGSLFTVLGALALFLAALGIYGVLSHTVVQRTQEIGIRAALGASPRDLLRWLAWLGGRLLLAGTVLGLAVSLSVSHLLKSILFLVTPWDPPTYVAITFVLLLAGVGASVMPVLRALRIAPNVAMRAE